MPSVGASEDIVHQLSYMPCWGSFWQSPSGGGLGIIPDLNNFMHFLSLHSRSAWGQSHFGSFVFPLSWLHAPVVGAGVAVIKVGDLNWRLFVPPGLS